MARPVWARRAWPSLDCVGVGHLHAQVVEAAALAGVFQQDQFEWRLSDGEVSVTGTDLGRLGAEQPGVERDNFADIGDVEGEPETTGHGPTSRDIDSCRSGSG